VLGKLISCDLEDLVVWFVDGAFDVIWLKVEEEEGEGASKEGGNMCV
jgi:hypothetical protein